MIRSRITPLLGTSFISVMFILLQLFQHHLRTIFGLPFSKALFGFSFFIFAAFGAGFLAALLYGWLRRKSKTAGALILIVLIITVAAALWLFFTLAASRLSIPVSWMLLLVSLYIPASGAAGYLSITLTKLADAKMADAEAAAVIKPLSIAFFSVTLIAAAAVGTLIWLA